MTAQPTIPPGGPFDPNAAFQGNMQMLAPGGSGAQQQANVPLWLVRPSSSGPGSSVMADRNIAGDQNGAGSANAAEEDARRQPASIANGQKFYSKDAAQSGWFDLSDDEKRAFMAKAQASGFWDPSQGMDNLVHAWYYAVELASQYNDNHKQDQWISPFEAVSKMAMQNRSEEHTSELQSPK